MVKVCHTDHEGNKWECEKEYPTIGHAIEATLLDTTPIATERRTGLTPTALFAMLSAAAQDIKARDMLAAHHKVQLQVAFWLGWVVGFGVVISVLALERWGGLL